MNIYIWNNELNKPYLWSSENNWVYVWKEKVWPIGRLPSGFQEVEYIQSSWTQVIAIQEKWGNTYKTVLDFQIVTLEPDICLVWIRNSSYMRYYIWVYDWAWRASSWSNTLSSVWTANTNRHTLILDNWKLTVDSTTYTVNNGSWTYNKWVRIFWYSDDSTGEYYTFSKCKLYSFKAYSGSTLLYDLVPCYRTSDNVIGLYDLVNSKFYINQWTWTFIKGNDV